VLQERRVLVLNSVPSSGMGNQLLGILEGSENPPVRIRHESVSSAEPGVSTSPISDVISLFKPHIVFLVLSSDYKREAGALIQLLIGKPFELPVIVAIEGDTPGRMIDLLELGVADFITPPLQAVDVLPRIWRFLEHNQTEDPLILRLKEKIGLKRMIGESPSFITEMEKIPLIARCDASVLISGETGTGKELFARAIHYLGPRAGKPFIPASCGAIPVELVENELFGHIHGAFTSATSSQTGLIQEAHGGTLFLDEIDCLPLLAQVKFLRFLQEKEYKQLGSPKVHHADLRVIAATNIDLEEAVKEKKFREDLYYRLNIIPLTLPSLRERKDDIPLLAYHFLEKYASEFKKQVSELIPEAIGRLTAYEWPGNVRELENAIERAVIFSKKAWIGSEDILLPGSQTPSPQESFKTAKANAVKEFERKYIEDLLVAHQGNISRAAESVHKNRRAFWELIRKYKIDVSSLKPSSKPG
jgi:two-component system, NtrC family, response regulator GlrR